MVNPRADEIKQKIVFLLLSCFLTTAAADLFGVRSSFLTGSLDEPQIWLGRFGTSLPYLSPTFGTDEERQAYRNLLKANGDTHIDIYAQARSTKLPGGSIYPEHQDFTAKLNELNADGLKPVLWLIPESRHGDHRQSMEAHLAFQNEMVLKHDTQIDGYVVCLECDETFTVEQVNALVANLKSRTKKKIAVHLAPGVGGYKRDTRYYKGADFIYLQIGDHLTGDYTADSAMAVAMLKEALKLGIPVVANEYSLLSTSAQARALGDLLCANGAAGTGNGRSIEDCGQRRERNQKWYEKYEKEMVVAGIAMATLFAVSRYDLPLTLQATENSYQIGMTGSTKNHTVGIDYRDDGAVMMSYRFSF